MTIISGKLIPLEWGNLISTVFFKIKKSCRFKRGFSGKWVKKMGSCEKIIPKIISAMAYKDFEVRLKPKLGGCVYFKWILYFKGEGNIKNNALN